MELSNISESLKLEFSLLIGGSIFLIALTGGLIFTGIMCHLSRRWGAVDKPDGGLKCHERATATLGGVPLFLGVGLGVIILVHIVYWLGGSMQWLGLSRSFLSGLTIAGLVIMLMGVSDDVYHVMPRTKLLVQIVAAMLLILSGLVIRRCDFFGVYDLSLGYLAIPFTLFWLVGSCNAFNFIDGMDGLASGIGVIASVLLAVLGFLTGQYGPALMALVLAGGLLGVLTFNIKPARIFLGDSGSQLVGLLLGALSIRIATSNGVFALPSAGLILSVPVLDALLSILRRISVGESLAHGDRQHVHHCLRKHGLGVTGVAVTLWITALIVGCMGIVYRYSLGMISGFSALALVMLLMYVGIRLGCLQPQILWERFTGNYRWKAVGLYQSGKGVAELEVLWERMKPLFEQMNLDRAILTLEGVGAEGHSKCQTYQWVRSEIPMAELLASRWIKRFALDGDERRVATLRLESAEQLMRDEKRIEWLLKQIRENMRYAQKLNHQQDQSLVTSKS